MCKYLSNNGAAMPRKGRLRNNRKKRRKKAKKRRAESHSGPLETKNPLKQEGELEDVQIEWVSAPMEDEVPEELRGVFENFLPPEELTLSKSEFEKREKEKKKNQEEKKVKVEGDHPSDEEEEEEEKGDDDGGSSEDDQEKPEISKREMKRRKRLSVAVLKQIVSRPDVVEVWDVTAADPALLVYLKSHRGTVPVPKHWCQKRKYLQGKRGIEKPPFELPDFIAATGISRVRQTAADADSEKSMKQRQREKMAPKMGKLDISYNVLHDAFFKYQTKPKLTRFGDMYYEGKEFEVQLSEKKPGHLSDKLKKALGMPEGAPPPWLINMQRYGPPPSYPKLKISGLNAPLPPGAQFGYHAGGWGEPPVDQLGRPLYGDVYGTNAPPDDAQSQQEIERKLWGELAEESEDSSDEDESSEDSSEEESSEEDPEDQDMGGIETPSGITTPAGYETPDQIEVRKVRPNEPKQLYQVLQREEVKAGKGAFVSTHGYVIPGKEKKAPKPKGAVDIIKSQKTKEYEVTLTPAEMDSLADSSFLEQKMESALQAQASFPKDMPADRRKKKEEKGTKEWKDFRF